MGLQSVDEVIDAEPINVTEEIRQNANTQEFVPEAPAPAITAGQKVTMDDLNKIEQETAEPMPVEAEAKAEEVPQDIPGEAPGQTGFEGPGF